MRTDSTYIHLLHYSTLRGHCCIDLLSSHQTTTYNITLYVSRYVTRSSMPSQMCLAEVAQRCLEDVGYNQVLEHNIQYRRCKREKEGKKDSVDYKFRPQYLHLVSGFNNIHYSIGASFMPIFYPHIPMTHNGDMNTHTYPYCTTKHLIVTVIQLYPLSSHQTTTHYTQPNAITKLDAICLENDLRHMPTYLVVT